MGRGLGGKSLLGLRWEGQNCEIFQKYIMDNYHICSSQVNENPKAILISRFHGDAQRERLPASVLFVPSNSCICSLNIYLSLIYLIELKVPLWAQLRQTNLNATNFIYNPVSNPRNELDREELVWEKDVCTQSIGTGPANVSLLAVCLIKFGTTQWEVLTIPRLPRRIPFSRALHIPQKSEKIEMEKKSNDRNMPRHRRILRSTRGITHKAAGDMIYVRTPLPLLPCS